MHPKRLDPILNTGSTFSDLWLPFDLDCNRQSEIYVVGLDSLLIIQTKDGKTRNCANILVLFLGPF